VCVELIDWWHAVSATVFLLSQQSEEISGNHTEAHLEVRQKVLQVGQGARRRGSRRGRVVEFLERWGESGHPQVAAEEARSRLRRARSLIFL